MLIIARRKGQRILIGDDVEVIVTELSKGVVKLGGTTQGTTHAVIDEAAIRGMYAYYRKEMGL
jgi:hypothetical protein